MPQFSVRVLVAIAVAALMSLIAASDALAADDYKVGDTIEVFYLNEWRPGTVLEVDKRGNVMAEYEFGAFPKKGGFKAAEVRGEYESGAIARGRTWSDPSGKFRIKAALLAIKDDESISLRKQDMSELSIPLKSLCEADKKFVKSLQKEGGLALMQAPEPPPIEDFNGGTGAFGSFAVPFAGRETTQKALAPDPLPNYLKMKQGGVAFPLDDFFDRLGAVLPLGGQDSWILAAIESGSPSKALPTRLVWASLAKRKVEGRQLLPGGEVVVDYHPPTRRLLTFAAVKAEGVGGWGKPALTLWEVSPTDKNAKPIVRWNADAGEGGLHEPWGRIIDGTLVVQRFKKQEYVAWDTAAKNVKWRINQESFFAPTATLSGGRKYLFVPEDTGVRVIETATGNLACALPAANGASGVAVSEDGTKAAVLEDNDLAIWDLTNPQSGPERYEAQAIGTPFSADLFWVGNERIMADKGAFGQVLFSMKTKIALWNYHFDMNAVSEHGGRRMREIVDRHLVYAASVGSGQQRGLAVGAVQLPGPKVDEVEAATNPESLLIIKPGAEVRIEVSAGEHTARVQKALEAEVTKNGWTLSDSATNVLIAEMKRGETQSTTYTGGGFGRPQTQETVTITPFISGLQLKVGDKIAWVSGTSTGAPPSLWLKEGQTAQGEVSRWQNPDPGFYERIDIPAKILDPDKRNGLGTTEVTNRGLIPK